MSIFKADRDLDSLEPEFRRKVDKFLERTKNMGIFVTEAGRSTGRQLYLVAKGLSFVKVSNHQRGLAIDIAFKDDPRTQQVERELYPKDTKRWLEVVKIANSCGIDWGYDLWNWDKPHFQDNGKRKISESTMKRIKAENIIFGRRSKKLNDALNELNAVTASLSKLKNKKFVPYTITRLDE